MHLVRPSYGLVVPTSRWTNVEKPLYLWVPTVERILKHQDYDGMDGPLIHIFSDYGGEHKGSEYNTFSALYVDVKGSRLWEAKRREARRRHLPDGRRLSFKGMNDRHKREALSPFLEAAKHISGLCVVLAVHKSVENLCWGRESQDIFVDQMRLSRTLPRHIFDRQLQVAHLISLLMGGLALSGQEVYWFSDEDSLFANPVVATDMGKLMEFFSGHYVRTKLGQVGLGTTAIDEGDRYEEDHVAITDLAAGAVADVLTTLRKKIGRLPSNLAVEFNGALSPKSDFIRSWFGDATGQLKKSLIVFEPTSSTQFEVFKLSM